jgi:hypothetical protein
MGASAFKQLIVFGQRPPLGSGGSENQTLAPSPFWGGVGLFEPRAGYSQTRHGCLMWYGQGAIPVIDAIPSTLGTTSVAASQVPTAGTALTLVASSGAGIVVLASPLVVWPAGNTIPANTLAVEQVPGIVAFGSPSVSSGFTLVSAYDPATMIARNVQIASVGNDSAATFLISGFDVYGFPMTDLVAGADAGTAKSTKTFKFISSIIPSGTLSGSDVSVGMGDTYGLPILANAFGYVNVDWAGAPVTSATGFTAADTTNPATSTTGDPRGTYTVQSASNGTNRLQIFVRVAVANANSPTGLFGVTPA